MLGPPELRQTLALECVCGGEGGEKRKWRKKEEKKSKRERLTRGMVNLGNLHP